jgi:hypothetical protein
MCTFSDPIDTKYNNKKDVVVAFVEPKYGENFWKISKIEIDYPSNGNIIFYMTEYGVLNVKRGYELQLFCKYLFEGKIFESFQNTSSNLIHDTKDFLKKKNLSKNSMIILELLFNKGNMLISKSILTHKWLN